MASQNIPRKRYSEGQFLDFSKQIGRSVRTLRRWRAQGCDLENPESLKKFLKEKEFLKPPIQKLREQGKLLGTNLQSSAADSPIHPNGELAPAGKRGAAAALDRLERQEEESHRRLERAQASGDILAIQAAQDFWLKCSETLRRLDLAIEISRRAEETQIPLRQAEETATAIAEWLRIAFAQFLSSETQALMGIREIGEYKAYAFERFKGIIDLTVRNSLKTNSPIPDWAIQRIKTAWNVE